MSYVSELYAERRYYREFHHKVFTLFVTILLTALGGHFIALGELGAVPVWAIVVLLCLVVVFLPVYATAIILRYHLVITGLSNCIVDCAKAEANAEQDSRSAQDIARSWHLGKRAPVPWSAVRRGWGHWFFISSIWAAAALNAAFWIAAICQRNAQVVAP